MKLIHLLLSLALIGCSTGSTGVASPTTQVLPEVGKPNPSPTLASLMNGLPTKFAPCAGKAISLQSAVVSCIKQWKPQDSLEIQPQLHFHPFVPKAARTKIRKAISLASQSIVGLLPAGISAMTVHVVLAQNRNRAYCDQVAKQYLAGTGNDWIWERGAADDAGFLDQWVSDGCGRVDDGMVATTSVPGLTSAWLFTDWTNLSKYDGSEGGISDAFIASIHAQAAKHYAYKVAEVDSFYLLPAYLAPYLNTANSLYLRFRTTGKDGLEQVIRSTLPKTSYHKSRWDGTFADDRFCPQKGISFSESCWGDGREFSGDQLYRDYPDVYLFNTVAFNYITAYFGVDWMANVFWPILLESYEVNHSNFDEVYDRVAQRIWGGSWSDLEKVLDQELRKELKRILQ